jgi:uncharacterized membrane protein
MVIVEHSSDGAQARILARGNFSLGTGGLLTVISLLGVVTLCLAGLLAWQGYWPVLMIAVVQIILVAWLLIRAWEQAWIVEKIEIGPGRIMITHQRYRDKRQLGLDSAWARIRVEQAESPWYAPRLLLRSGNQEIELGAFLTGEEKIQLAEYLSAALAQHSAWQEQNG